MWFRQPPSQSPQPDWPPRKREDDLVDYRQPVGLAVLRTVTVFALAACYLPVHWTLTALFEPTWENDAGGVVMWGVGHGVHLLVLISFASVGAGVLHVRATRFQVGSVLALCCVVVAGLLVPLLGS